MMLAPPIPPGSRAAALAHQVQLGDGAVVEVRAIRPDDGERLRRFHARLSPESIWLRYFHIVSILPDVSVASFTHVDYENQMALVATAAAGATLRADTPDALPALHAATQPLPHEIVSMASYYRISAESAEVAFLVEDAWQGKGIASVLLYDLAAYGHACGFRSFLATTLTRNTRMLDLLEQSGFPCTLHEHGDDEIDAWLDITGTPMCRFVRFAR